MGRDGNREIIPKERASIRNIVLGGEIMLFTHRSVSYDDTSPQIESGLSYKEDNHRGINSSRNVSEATPIGSIASRMRALQAGKSQNIKQREQSMLARLNVEVGLPPENAAHYDNTIQGKTRYNFTSYDRSSVAMS